MDKHLPKQNKSMIFFILKSNRSGNYLFNLENYACRIQLELFFLGVPEYLPKFVYHLPWASLAYMYGKVLRNLYM